MCIAAEFPDSNTSSIQPTLYFVLEPPDVIPLPVDQGLSSVVECWPLNPEVQGSNSSPERFSLLITLSELGLGRVHSLS